MADTVTVSADLTPVITAGLNAFGQVIKLTEDELAILNSPQFIQARINVKKQKADDQIAKDADEALKTGNLKQVETDLS